MIPARLTGKPFWDIYGHQDPLLWKAYIDTARYFDIDAGFELYDFSDLFGDEAPRERRIVPMSFGRINVSRLSVFTRAQMAVFLLHAKHGAAYNPPAATGLFSDVPTTYWAANWVEQLYTEGITGGCSQAPLSYCPGDPAPRAQMAVFLVRTFNLP